MQGNKNETAHEVPVQEQLSLKNRKRTKHLNEECMNLAGTIADFDIKNENESIFNIVYLDS